MAIKTNKYGKNKRKQAIGLKLKREIRAGSETEQYFRTPKGVKKDKKAPVLTGNEPFYFPPVVEEEEVVLELPETPEEVVEIQLPPKSAMGRPSQKKKKS